MSEEFRGFSRSWKFQHTISSAYNSQSNSKVESAVKIANRILKRSTNPWLALRNTPTVGMGSSPCQHLFSRRTRSVVPVKETQLEPVQVNTQERKVQHQNQLKGLNLPPLRVGQPVLMQDLRQNRQNGSRVFAKGSCQGQLLHWNRRFLTNTVKLNGPGDPFEDERWPEGSQSEVKPTVSEEAICEQLMEGESEQECKVKLDQGSGEQDHGPSKIKGVVEEIDVARKWREQRNYKLRVITRPDLGEV